MPFIKLEMPLVGCITLVEDNDQLVRLDFCRTSTSANDSLADSCATPLLYEVKRQLLAYFAGQLRVFDLPLAPKGTPFQLKVWKALQGIAYGQTCSYGDIARDVDNPRAARAVGLANNRNPLSIVIPCHRVVGADGRLVGYGGGLDIKRRLLALENAQPPVGARHLVLQ